MKIIYKDGHVDECPQDQELHVIRHTAAHIMAQAIKRLYPQADFAFGPATENGFYYDVDLGDQKLSEKCRMIVRLRIRRDLTRGLVLNISPLQLGNRGINATINERDDDTISTLPLRMQGPKIVPRVVRLIRRCDLAIHRLCGGSGGDGREHGRQGQGAGRGQNGEGTQTSGPTDRSHRLVCSFRSGAQALGLAGKPRPVTGRGSGGSCRCVSGSRVRG